MADLSSYEVVAFNTATASTNKIHDDGVARRYGFAGGLVPGVDVYAYLTHPPAATWGLDWLSGGTMAARFVAPVYEGRRVRVLLGPDVDGEIGAARSLEALGEDGAVHATGRASLGEPAPPPDLARWTVPAPAADRPPASPASLAPGRALAVGPRRFLAARAGEYLDDVREPLSLYRDEGVAHPGWLLRLANEVLAANVVLGPWIHVESTARHHAAVRDGDTVSARALVVDEWERKGHRFVRLDVVILVDDDRVVAHVDHTAIYQPRAASA